MTTTTNDKTAVELAQLRAELHSTNTNMARIATALEQTLKDHEERMRVIERALQAINTFIGLVKWVGAPAAAAAVLYFAKLAQ